MEYLANICTDKHETNEAIRFYSECLKTSSASKWVYFNLAKSYFSINENDKQNIIDYIKSGDKGNKGLLYLIDKLILTKMKCLCASSM